MRTTQKTGRGRKASDSRSNSQFGRLCLILLSASNTSAFQSSPPMSLPLTSLQRVAGSPLSEASSDIPSRSRRKRPEFLQTSSPKVQTTILPSSTTLRFSGSDDDEPTAMSSPGQRTSRWWESLFSFKNEVADEEQDTVDEYLEFLDRRYRRLHSSETENQNSKKQKGFSALSWLLQGKSQKCSDPLISNEQQDDALFVLGVAGLASQKLLQKHHLRETEVRTPPATAEREAVAEPARKTPKEFIDAQMERVTPDIVRGAVLQLAKTLHETQKRKELFVKSQLHKLSSFVSTTTSAGRSMINGPPKAASAILEFGGGKKTFALTLTLASALLLLLRRLLKAAISDVPLSP